MIDMRQLEFPFTRTGQIQQYALAQERFIRDNYHMYVHTLPYGSIPMVYKNFVATFIEDGGAAEFRNTYKKTNNLEDVVEDTNHITKYKWETPIFMR